MDGSRCTSQKIKTVIFFEHDAIEKLKTKPRTQRQDCQPVIDKTRKREGRKEVVCGRKGGRNRILLFLIKCLVYRIHTLIHIYTKLWHLYITFIHKYGCSTEQNVLIIVARWSNWERKRNY